MNRVARILIYVVLLLTAVHCFRQFRLQYNLATEESAAKKALAMDPDAVGTNSPAGDPGTNSPTELASADATGEVATNAVDGSLTNLTTASGISNTVVAPKSANAGSQQGKTWPVYLGLFVLSLLGLAGFGGWDVSKAIASKANAIAFDEDGDGGKDPDYEAAEQVHAQGDHLEAIRLMREFLKENPTEQYAAIRIAEIYEKDLNNPVAAAMEYEEILQKKLPREKWGWTAIHLSNVYSGRLSQPDKALALLEKIAAEYPETGAAKKARQRLGHPEPDSEVDQTDSDTSDSTPPPPDEGSSLPRGFRMKK